MLLAYSEMLTCYSLTLTVNHGRDAVGYVLWSRDMYPDNVAELLLIKNQFAILINDDT